MSTLARYAWLLIFILPSAAQERPDVAIDGSIRSAIIESLVSRLDATYVVPETGRIAVRKLRAAAASHDYDGLGMARPFAEKLTSDLRTVTHDKHIALNFDPEIGAMKTPPVMAAGPRDRFNYGFNKVERLRGNVGYLDLRSFADLNEARDTASTFLSALANFDAIIIDLRQNGGGNTPMMAHVASYFFGPKPVHLSDMYWRDQNQTIELWTSENLPGRRSVTQDLFILVGPSTFSAAEDFCYSLQQLKRATLVGETTGGGAHMARGLQRLSPLFTAFIPTGQTLNPITKSNWEGVGVEPDVKVPANQALLAAHVRAVQRLLQKETDPKWQDILRQTLADLAAGK